MGEAHSRICLAGEDLDWTGGCSILCAINMKMEVKITQIDGERIVIKSNRVNDGYISYLDKRIVQRLPCIAIPSKGNRHHCVQD